MFDIWLIQKIKDAANIVEVIGEFMTLKKSGKSYECLCPFHADRNLGNFKVNPKRGCYTCFSCGAHGNAIDFLMNYAGMTFSDAIRYLGVKYGIYVDDVKAPIKPKVKCEPNTPPPPLPMMTFNESYLNARRDLTNDNLVNWIKSLRWTEQERASIPGILNAYYVGHSADGRSIFWQIDETFRVRTAKLMRYHANGHRVKENYSTTWMHTIFEQAKMFDPDQKEIVTTLFGLHLLDASPNADINIVESEKTALLAAIYFRNFDSGIWMASGGKSMITREKLLPIIARKRNIVLYPDIDAIDEWEKLAKELEYDRVRVNSTFIKRNWREQDGQTADLADIIVRILGERRSMKPKTPAQVIEKMAQTNPELNNLITKLGLEPVTP